MELPPPNKVPFNQKWELHKAELERLYENLTVPQIVKFMKDERDFDAK